MTSIDFKKAVFVHRIEDFDDYFDHFPYSPSLKYPEYFFGHFSKSNNAVYDRVRRLFFQMGLDKKNYETKKWNPFGDFIKPGQTVLIKPNWVMDHNPSENNTDALITNISIIRPVIDYVLLALANKGELILGDASLQTCNFEKLLKDNCVKELISFYRKKTKTKLSIVDFRYQKAVFDSRTYTVTKLKRVNKKSDFIVFDLGKKSEFCPINKNYFKFRVSNYDKNKMFLHHNQEKNEYFVNKRVLEADVIINLPKLKVHKKSGITGALKNSVGINGSKDWLPHYQTGGATCGGDSYPNSGFLKKVYDYFYENEFVTKNILKRKIFWFFKNIFLILIKISQDNLIFDGSWLGNDTLWRTILDLNRIVDYGDKKGFLNQKPRRTIFNLVDGLIIGEKDGPLAPSSKKAGLLIAGFNQVSVDAVSARLIGFNYLKIPQIIKAFKSTLKPRLINDLDICTIINGKKVKNFEKLPTLLKAIPNYGWEDIKIRNDK